MTEAKNGPRMLNLRLRRNDYFHHHDYTLTIADAVTIHLTDRQARDLYQLLHDELRPRATLAATVVSMSPQAIIADVIAGFMPEGDGGQDGMVNLIRAEEIIRALRRHGYASTVYTAEHI